MNKRMKIVFGAIIAVVVGLAVLAVILIIGNSRHADDAYRNQQTVDSLMLANDRLELTNEFDKINADFNAFEDQQIYLKNDSLVLQYNEAKQKVENLLKQLDAEKRDNSRNKERIKRLEAEISTLRGIVKHYLEEIKRLGEENEGLKREIESVTARNEELASQVSTTTSANKELAQTVRLAKKLNITGLSLTAYNKKDKPEKNVTKARKLGVSFTVSPNNTAAPGRKDFYVRIISPEGSLLGGGGSFSYDGATLNSTAHRSMEYDNGELGVSVYWTVNSTLTPGEYTVEVFCDGYRLGSRRIAMRK